jgi:hypothetical protein
LKFRSAAVALLLCTLHHGAFAGEFGTSGRGELVSTQRGLGHRQPALVTCRRLHGRSATPLSQALATMLPRLSNPRPGARVGGSGEAGRVLRPRSRPRGARSPPRPTAVTTHSRLMSRSFREGANDERCRNQYR